MIEKILKDLMYYIIQNAAYEGEVFADRLGL